MPGFLGKAGEIETANVFSKNQNKKLINKKLLLNDFYIEQRTIDKFQQDKIFENNRQYFVLTEGVIIKFARIDREISNWISFWSYYNDV